MRKELVFNNEHNNYSIDKHYFRKDKKPINISELDINRTFLSNKAPYGKQGSYKYYLGYLRGTGFRPLHIIIKKNRIIY